MKGRDRLVLMGFIAYLATLTSMVLLISKTPVEQHSGSSSSSSSDSSSIQKMAVMRLIKKEAAQKAGKEDSLEQMEYLLNLLKQISNKANDTKIEEEEESEPIKEVKEPGESPVEPNQNLNLQVHDIQITHFELTLPFSMEQNTKKADISRLTDIVNSMRKHRKTWKKEKRKNAMVYGERVSTSWEVFHNHIGQYDLYAEDDPNVARLLNDMSTIAIKDAEQKPGGTQIKLLMGLKDDGEVLFKPMRYPRNTETLPNHFYFSDYERHTAEIAAFHLDRLLGFRRAPPVVGRLVNITRDILPFADRTLAKTFFISPAGNLCFHGKCSYYCDTSHAICGSPIMLEGSVAHMLPSSKMVLRRSVRHPWRRSYHKRKRAVWEEDNDYCNVVRDTAPYNTGHRLLHLIDLAVFDFLIGNQDRHHYDVMTHFGNDSYLVHFDHGRAFGKPKFDDLSALAPLYQCCLIRYSTLDTLLKYNNGQTSLGMALKKSLTSDPLNPILIDSHFDAVDRRVRTVLQMVYKCISQNKYYNTVIKDDGF